MKPRYLGKYTFLSLIFQATVRIEREKVDFFQRDILMKSLAATVINETSRPMRSSRDLRRESRRKLLIVDTAWAVRPLS